MTIVFLVLALTVFCQILLMAVATDECGSDGTCLGSAPSKETPSPMAYNIIVYDRETERYMANQTALDELGIDIGDDEFVAVSIVGKMREGKSTLAGLLATNAQTDLFATASLKENEDGLTRGLWAVYVRDDKTLYADVEGLFGFGPNDGERKSGAADLLAFAHVLSSSIVYYNRRALWDSALMNEIHDALAKVAHLNFFAETSSAELCLGSARQQHFVAMQGDVNEADDNNPAQPFLKPGGAKRFFDEKIHDDAIRAYFESVDFETMLLPYIYAEESSNGSLPKLKEGERALSCGVDDLRLSRQFCDSLKNARASFTSDSRRRFSWKMYRGYLELVELFIKVSRGASTIDSGSLQKTITTLIANGQEAQNLCKAALCVGGFDKGQEIASFVNRTVSRVECLYRSATVKEETTKLIGSIRDQVDDSAKQIVNSAEKALKARAKARARTLAMVALEVAKASVRARPHPSKFGATLMYKELAEIFVPTTFTEDAKCYVYALRDKFQNSPLAVESANALIRENFVLPFYRARAQILQEEVEDGPNVSQILMREIDESLSRDPCEK